MTADEGLLASSLWKLGDVESDDAGLDERVIRFQGALRRLRTDPDEAARIDALVADAEASDSQEAETVLTMARLADSRQASQQKAQSASDRRRRSGVSEELQRGSLQGESAMTGGVTTIAKTDAPDPARTGIDTTVPRSARIWNYWLGGTDNYAVDREAGDQYKEVFPGIAVVARTSRAFLTRAVRYLAAEAGMRQFLDIGTGLTTASNIHQVAQSVAPESKVVYVDNDPLVLAHARALLTSSPEGTCDYLDADIRNAVAILDTAAGLLDFTQPVALMLMGIMGHFTDDEAYPIVSQLLADLPSGSYLALYDGANTNEAFNQAQQGYNDSGAVPYHLRSREQFERFFEGLDLVEPGVVPVPHWRPDPGAEPVEIYSYCGVGRMP